MAELANCSRCGKVYVRGIRDICQQCYKEEEEAFQTVYKFLRDRKNREATILEIVEATDVEEALITKFVREGRLRPSEFPSLSYPCERCQTPIQKGRYCINCLEDFKKGLERHEAEESKDAEREGQGAYVAFNKQKNNE